MAKISPYAFFQEFDDNGAPLDGGLLYTYEAGTTTPKVTYTDSTEDTANANPVVLDASGRADVWLTSGAYKFVIKTSADVTVKEVDSIVGEASNVFGGATQDIATSTAITESFQNNIIDCTAALTLSLLDVSTAGEGFLFTMKNSGDGVVTIDPDAAETINGAATLLIYPSQSCLVYCTGTAWKTAFLGQYRRNNYTATTAPAVTDDSSDGYFEGSVWYDITADEAYICLDSTEGAAVWLIATLTIADLGASATKGFIDDDTFATASDSTTASSESIKAYVDAGDAWTESSEVTVATGDQEYTAAHGLGVVPEYQAVLRCKTTDLGYAVGTEVPVTSSAGDSGNATGTYTSSADATNCMFEQNAGIGLTNTSGGFSTITYANWKLVFYYKTRVTA